MIAREWVGQTATADADSYMAFLRRTGLADYRRTPGNQGVLVLRRDRADDVSEFRLLSFWDSFDSIRRFVGPDVNKAYYYPDDPKYLLSLDDSISHYEVLEAGGDRQDGQDILHRWVDWVEAEAGPDWFGMSMTK